MLPLILFCGVDFNTALDFGGGIYYNMIGLVLPKMMLKWGWSMKEYKGLSQAEAEQLLLKNGKNCLKEEKPKTVFRMFLEQILNFTNAILAAAIIISIILADYGEAVIMLVIVIANAIIGVVQEGKAQKALDALKKMSVLKATVIRDGETKEISSEELVVGDYVVLEAGKQVPADLKLIETARLLIDEKALTGESVPVEKDHNFVPDSKTGIGDRLDLAYMSTIVTYGRGVGIVDKTGMDTQIGKIADMVGKEKDKPSPLQKGMDGLSRVLGIGVIVICAVVFLIGFLQGREPLDLLMAAVSLAVAAIPEGIPTIVTIVLALGMQRMAKINAIVKSMPAVETLGAVSYVCSDKTGTLTQNKMTVVKAFQDGKYIDLDTLDKDKYDTLLKGFMLCNDASIASDGTEVGDPTETALVAFAKRYGIEKSETEKKMVRINEKAFDSDRKLMTTVHRTPDKKIISYTKGSTDELLMRCTKIMTDGKVRDIGAGDIALINKTMTEMSNDALRVLSLAIREDNADAIEQNLTYIGMIGMIDPERPEVVESIKTFKRAGIKTVMITGDHKDTALAIAKKLGIAERPDECIMGHELDELSDVQLKEKAKGLSIYARVSPEHKVKIVKAIQANGNISSMTGDGVNDAPSLKAADVGVAMGITGTDVAKGAADIILQDDKFTTIEKAVKEGRNIYENVKKSILFALSSNVSEILVMFAAIVAGLAAPLTAVHILWINLLTDSLPCFALGVDPNSSSDVMNKKPRKNGESIFAGGGYAKVGVYSIVIALVTLVAFLFYPIKDCIDNGQIPYLGNIIERLSKSDSMLIRSQTMAFCTLAMSELFHAIGMRDTEHSLFKFNHLDNKIMILAFFFGLIGQVAVTEIPFLMNVFGTCRMTWKMWLFITVISLAPLVVHEIWVLIKLLKKRSASKAK